MSGSKDHAFGIPPLVGVHGRNIFIVGGTITCDMYIGEAQISQEVGTIVFYMSMTFTGLLILHSNLSNRSQSLSKKLVIFTSLEIEGASFTFNASLP